FSVLKSGVQIGALEFASESPAVTQGWKCRHGFELNGFLSAELLAVGVEPAGPGINKDSPSEHRHDEARRFAYVHTMKFVLDLLADKRIQSDPAIILGFMDHATTTNYPHDCPAPVTRHVHNPNYMDVNARKWNDTGLLVKPG